MKTVYLNLRGVNKCYYVIVIDKVHVVVVFTKNVFCGLSRLIVSRVANQLCSSHQSPYSCRQRQTGGQTGTGIQDKCCDYQATYIRETGRNLSTCLTKHKRATSIGDVNNHIVEHDLQTKHQIDWDWDYATCITYCTDYYRLQEPRRKTTREEKSANPGDDATPDATAEC